MPGNYDTNLTDVELKAFRDWYKKQYGPMADYQLSVAWNILGKDRWSQTVLNSDAYKFFKSNSASVAGNQPGLIYQPPTSQTPTTSWQGPTPAPQSPKWVTDYSAQGEQQQRVLLMQTLIGNGVKKDQARVIAFAPDALQLSNDSLAVLGKLNTDSSGAYLTQGAVGAVKFTPIVELVTEYTKPEKASYASDLIKQDADYQKANKDWQYTTTKDYSNRVGIYNDAIKQYQKDLASYQTYQARMQDQAYKQAYQFVTGYAPGNLPEGETANMEQVAAKYQDLLTQGTFADQQRQKSLSQQKAWLDQEAPQLNYYTNLRSNKQPVMSDLQRIQNSWVDQNRQEQLYPSQRPDNYYNDNPTPQPETTSPQAYAGAMGDIPVTGGELSYLNRMHDAKMAELRQRASQFNPQTNYPITVDNTNPGLNRFTQGQYGNVLNQFMVTDTATTPQNPDLALEYAANRNQRWQDYLQKYPFLQKYMGLTASQRGENPNRFAPRTLTRII